MSKKKSDDGHYWYARNTGKFRRKTAHLSLVQMGAYDRLLDWYYDNRKPLPQEWVQLHRICGAICATEQDAVASVVQEFFILLDDGWHNKTADEEIAKAQGISQSRREAWEERERQRLAKEGANGGANASANGHTITNTTTIYPSKDKSLEGDAGAVDDIKPKTRKGKDNGARLQVWYENAGCKPGSLPAGWADYPRNKFGWNDREIGHVANSFWRYWTGPDARDPVKKDWGRAWQGWCDRANSRGEHRVSAQAAHQKPGGLSFNKILDFAQSAASQD